MRTSGTNSGRNTLRSLMRSAPVIIACLLAITTPALGAGPSYAVRAGRIITGTDANAAGIEDGVLIIRDGTIVTVGGPDTEIPLDLAILELPSQTIMPGLIAATTRLSGNHDGAEAVSGLFRAVDGFDTYADLSRWLASGVTAVHLNPGDHRLVSGRGAVVRLGGDPEGRILAPESDIQVNFTPGAMNAPDILRLLIPPAADGMILPPLRQPGRSRLDMRAALDAAVEAGREGVRSDGDFSPHLDSFGEAWDAQTPVRIRADRAADIAHAIELARSESRRRTALIGAAEAGEFVSAIGAMRLGVVYELDEPRTEAAGDRGLDPEPLRRTFSAFAALADDDRIPLALAPSGGDPMHLRLTGAMARASGADDARLIRAMTSDAARILGVDDQIGALEPGRRADYLVLSGDPLNLQSSVRRVYIDGRLVFQHPASESMVIRGGTVWLGPGEWLDNASVLIEDGLITAVGRTVPSPPGARMVDAGRGAFITPGFIDGRGHLAFGSSVEAPVPSFEIERTLGAADLDALRVAEAGVTTIINAPRRLNNNGSRFAAIKTAGQDRASRIVDPIAAIAFDLRGGPPDSIDRQIRRRIESGKRYHEKWVKYREEIAAWEKAKLEGTDFEASEDEEEEAPAEAADDDPVTGTWMMTVTAEVIPEPVSGRVALTLSGNQVEGRVIEPEAAEVEHRIVGVLDGDTITGSIEIDTGGAGTPTFTLKVPGNDTATGTIELADFGISLSVEGSRVDKKVATFKVVRKRSTTGRDGRPLPPPIDESEEPWRRAFDKEIPIALFVDTAAEINAALDVLKEFELGAVLIAPDRAGEVAARLKEQKVGVIAPPSLASQDYQRGGAFGTFVPALEYARAGIEFGLQSGAADGAASLPDMGVAGVALGLSPDHVLAALTIHTARAYMLDDTIGVIAPGRHADLLIFDGHPFEAGSTLRRVFVGGKEIAR
ncbi:MAG: amidohydrolase family protein [Phycisphaerales bacterium]